MKKLREGFKGLLVMSALLVFSAAARAQSYTDSLAQDEQDILSSIAPYKEDVRTAILTVSQYPQALVKLERVQARSSQSFQDMIAGYSREEQEKLYEISRFPELIKQITGNGRMRDEDVRPLLKDFPAAAQTRMLQTYSTHFDDLVKMNSLYNSSQDALQNIISSYPVSVQDDFQKVVGMPDVINLLTENINLTVSLGEEYKADPNGVRRELDALSADLETKNNADLAEYKKEVANDPKLQTEMKSAATDFSSAYDQPDNPTYVTNNYYDNYPYPYWFSYPYWYTTPIWYPRPIYYHTGFYYGPGGGLVVVGLPSRMYSSWFYGRGYRHYPYLYHHYNSYYNFHHDNVYRGFNRTAHDYSRNSGNGQGRGNRNGGGAVNHYNRPSTNNNGNGGYNNNGGRTNTTGRGNRQAPALRDSRNSQMIQSPNRVNDRGMQQFHATTYHSMGWQNVAKPGNSHTTARPSGGGVSQQTHFNSGGGTRNRTSGGGGSGGGAQHSGGSQHSGGGGGRGRH